MSIYIGWVLAGMPWVARLSFIFLLSPVVADLRANGYSYVYSVRYLGIVCLAFSVIVKIPPGKEWCIYTRWMKR
jgi:hypothetical protein